MADSSGGNEVWRRGWEVLGVEAGVGPVFRRRGGGPPALPDREREGRFLGLLGRGVW